MKTFIWQGFLNGKNESGTIDVPDKITAVILLEDKNISNIRLTRLKKIKLKKSDHYFLLAELCDLFNANISLLNAIHIIGSTHKKFFLICKKLKELLKNGSSLAKSLESCQLYNTTTYTLIHTGEQTGQLAVILKKIIEQHKQQTLISNNIKKALMYPAFVLITTLVVLLAMLLFIIPKFSSMFHQFNAKLPFFTKMIIQLSDGLKTHGGLILLSLILLMSTFIFLLKYYKSTIIDNLLFIPYLNTLLTDNLYARIFFLLNTCLTSGLSLQEALTLVIPTLSFKRYFNAFTQITTQLKAGYSFSQSLNPQLFPEKIRQWVVIAENSGTLEFTCKTIGDHYSNTLKEKSEKISLLIEPFIMVVLGLCIGSIVVAMYLPLFQIGLAM